MKVLMVGDNRDQLNWGGRGQSLALHRLLEQNIGVSDVVYGNAVNSVIANDGYVRTILPTEVANLFLRVRKRSKLIDYWLKMEDLWGARDFVSDDPEASAETLLKFRSRRPGLSQLYDAVKRSDVVVVNGEGSGVFSTPYRRDFFFYLMIIALAYRLGKPSFYVNAILSDCPNTGRNTQSVDAARRILARCETVALRDPESYDLVRKEMPEVRGCYIPDALFTWFPIYDEAENLLPRNGDFIIPFPDKEEHFGKLDFSVPYICIGGSSLAAYSSIEARDRYRGLVKRLRGLGLATYLIQSCGGDDFLESVAQDLGIGIVPGATPIYMCGAVLANARLLISGRFHPSILASLGGTPCVFLEAHSHKMRSLQRALGYDKLGVFSALPSDNEATGILEVAREYLESGDSLRNRIRRVSAKLCEEAAQLSDVIKSGLDLHRA